MSGVGRLRSGAAALSPWLRGAAGCLLLRRAVDRPAEPQGRSAPVGPGVDTDEGREARRPCPDRGDRGPHLRSIAQVDRPIGIDDGPLLLPGAGPGHRADGCRGGLRGGPDGHRPGRRTGRRDARRPAEQHGGGGRDRDDGCVAPERLTALAVDPPDFQRVAPQMRSVMTRAERVGHDRRRPHRRRGGLRVGADDRRGPRRPARPRRSVAWGRSTADSRRRSPAA